MQFHGRVLIAPLRVSKPYSLSVPDPPFLLVPAKATENALVGGIKVDVGSYVYLTENVKIEPTILCLVIKASRK